MIVPNCSETEKNKWHSTLLEDKSIDLSFQLPNLQELQQARHNRNQALFHSLSSTLYENPKKLTTLEKAAISIQKVFRGYLGRKYYLDVLYDSVFAGEEALKERQEMQVGEGEILIENYRMERDLEEFNDISRNKSRLLNTNAVKIQRAWREKEKKKGVVKDHMCCTCNEDYPDLYEYYSETKMICFCCDEHKINKEFSFTVSDEYVFDPVVCEESLPYPTTDWLNIDSVLTKQTRSYSNTSADIEEMKSRLSVNQDVQLTFVESYESDKANLDVEIYNTYDDIDSSEFIGANIEKVTDTNKNRSPDQLEPVEESTRVFKVFEDSRRT